MKNNIYYINTYVGSNDQLLKLALDTQRRYKSISGGRNCTYMCKAGLFDDTKSNSFVLLNNEYKVVNEELIGILGSDKIRIHELTESFHLMLISSLAKSIEFKIDGYMGLGFTKEKENNIIYKLFKSGLIKIAYTSSIPPSKLSRIYYLFHGNGGTIFEILPIKLVKLTVLLTFFNILEIIDKNGNYTNLIGKISKMIAQVPWNE